MEYNKPSPLTVWIVWIALFESVFLYQFLIGGGIPTGEDQGEPDTYILVLGSVVAIVASLIRWLILPKAKNFQVMFTAFIVGMALSESIAIYGLFLIGEENPESQLSFMVLSLLCMLQYTPVFAGKFGVEQVDEGNGR